jgi:C4-dicarboxylate transporter, DctM subunit
MISDNMLLYLVMLLSTVLLFIGFPVGFTFLLGGILFVIFTSVPYFSFYAIPEYGFHAVDVFALMAVPFFLLAGELMKEGGLTEKLISFADSILGRIRGKMGAVTVVASMFFGAISGSSLACVAAMGSMMVPEMVKTGYKKEKAAALTIASGFIGMLIPPSVPAIFLSVVTGLSIGTLFLATILPGFIIAFGYILINYFVNGRQIPLTEEDMQISPFFSKTRLKIIRLNFYNGFFALLFPVIILGGIYGGIFSPTEAAVVAVVYSILIGYFFYKGLTLKGIYNILLNTAIMTACICVLVAFVAPIGQIFSILKLSDQLGAFIAGISPNPIITLLMLNVALLFLGMFVETAALIVITGPIFFPIAVSAGIDPIHFGAVMILNLGIGMLSPPFAYMIFVGARVTNLKVSEIIKPLLVYLVWCIITLLLCSLIPSITLFLPRVLLGYV